MKRPRTLKSAAEAGDLEAVEFHLANGADINGTTSKGHFALGGAVLHRHAPVVAFLIERGANVNLKSEYGWTPLYLAAWIGDHRVAKLLLSAGARLNDKTTGGFNSPAGYSPLHIAAERGHMPVVKLLADAGARMNLRDGMRQTPLDVAVNAGKRRVAKFLIASGGRSGSSRLGSVS